MHHARGRRLRVAGRHVYPNDHPNPHGGQKDSGRNRILDNFQLPLIGPNNGNFGPFGGPIFADVGGWVCWGWPNAPPPPPGVIAGTEPDGAMRRLRLAGSSSWVRCWVGKVLVQNSIKRWKADWLAAAKCGRGVVLHASFLVPLVILGALYVPRPHFVTSQTVPHTTRLPCFSSASPGAPPSLPLCLKPRWVICTTAGLRGTMLPVLNTSMGPFAVARKVSLGNVSFGPAAPQQPNAPKYASPHCQVPAHRI